MRIPSDTTKYYSNNTKVNQAALPGGEELAVSGSIRAIGGESSPIPGRAFCLSNGAGSLSPQEPWVGWGGDCPGGSSGGRGSPYKDLLAKTAAGLLDSDDRRRCGGWAIVAECSSGKHGFGKKIVCGREWCSECGEDNSAAHKRRQARIIPKVQQIETLGYFVVEFPEICRSVGQGGLDPDMDGKEKVQGWCYSKDDLRLTTNKVVEVLAGRRRGRSGRARVGGYFKRGLLRWHWFGDRRPGKLNQHLNILVDFDSFNERVREEMAEVIDAYEVELRQSKQTKKVRKELRGIELYRRGRSGYLPVPVLEKIKDDLRKALNCDLIVHYSFVNTPGQIVHRVRYVTRATFRDYNWDRYLARELYNFRNIRWWGSWDSEVRWSLGDAARSGENVDGLDVINNLQGGVCPDCGIPLKAIGYDRRSGAAVCWSKPVDSVYLTIWGAEEIAGTGYYRIPYSEWSGYEFSPDELMRLSKMEHDARAAPSTRWSWRAAGIRLARKREVDRIWQNLFQEYKEKTRLQDAQESL